MPGLQPWKPDGWSSLRDRWLNPPEWVEWVDEPVPGYPKRPVPRKRRTHEALMLPWLPRTAGRPDDGLLRICQR